MTDALDLLRDIESAVQEAIDRNDYIGESRDSLDRLLDATRQMVPELEYAVDQINPLVISTSDEETLGHAFAAWEELGVGSISSSALSGVATLSPTFNCLRKHGIDINGAYRFSEKEIKIARIFGVKFKSFPQYADMLRKPQFKDFKVGPSSVSDVNEAMRSLEKLGVISNYKMRERVQLKDGTSYERNYNRRAKNPGTGFRAIYEKVCPEHQSLVSGHWLNAFAYFVALDHLSRQDKPFEIYTRVDYELPSDISQDSGDFDLLARAGNSFLFIECKSGNLWSDRAKDGLDKVGDKARELEDVFSRVSGEMIDRYYILLCNPREGDDMTAVRDALQGTGIDVIMLDELRQCIHKIFGFQ